MQRQLQQRQPLFPNGAPPRKSPHPLHFNLVHE